LTKTKLSSRRHFKFVAENSTDTAISTGSEGATSSCRWCGLEGITET